jgi:Fic family protein
MYLYRMYIHELDNWPHFTYSRLEIEAILIEINEKEIKLKTLMSLAGIGKMEQLEQDNIIVEIVKNFEIEAVRLNTDDVRSSLLKKLGLDSSYMPTKRNIDGYVEAAMDALKSEDRKLINKRLIKWHSCLFYSGKTENGMNIIPGRFRDAKDGKMTVSSGMLGREKVHFVAPQGDQVLHEMRQFINWFNQKENNHPIVKSAIAHFYFITIHPFTDGNGRLSRIISDMVLASKSVLKYYSISEQIQAHKKEYYAILEKSQKQSNLDITKFIKWYLDMTIKAINVTEQRIEKIFAEVKFYDIHRLVQLNQRQKLIIDSIFKQEVFNKLNTARYAKYFDISKETASRDLVDLYKKGLISKLPAGGRETAYYIEVLGMPDEFAFGKSKQFGF